MALKSFVFLLVLALLSSRADDLRAAATPDPDDDVLAAQDNEYLPVATDHRLRIGPNDDTSVGTPKAGISDQLPLASSAAASLPSKPAPFLPRDPLSSLMSFQC